MFHVNNILIKGVTWIGDVVMTMPALATIRRNFPLAKITHIGRPWAEDILKTTDTVDNFISITDPGNGILTFIKEMTLARRADPDLTVIFPNSFRSALVSRVSGSKRQIGYETQGRGILITDKVKVPSWKNIKHESIYYQHLADICSTRFGDSKTSGDTLLEVQVGLTDGELSDARELLKKMSNGDLSKLVAIGAGSTNSRAKRWPVESFSQLILMLSDKGMIPVFLGSAADNTVISPILNQPSNRAFSLSGDLSVRRSMAVLALCSATISNDTGLAHLSAAVKTPTLTIFGPTDPATTRPLGVYSEIIRNPVDCSPCMLRDCPIDHRCMTGITPEVVFERLMKLISVNH